MILSIDQYHRDYDDSPELRAIDLDRIDGSVTVMTSEEFDMLSPCYDD